MSKHKRNGVPLEPKEPQSKHLKQLLEVYDEEEDIPGGEDRGEDTPPVPHPRANRPKHSGD